MARKTMRRTQGTFETEQVQRNVEDFVKANVPNWIADGVMIEDVILTAGSTSISHGLQRVPKGYVLTDQRANAVIYRTASTSTTLTLLASATVTVNLWVF